VKRLRRENAELKRANAILKSASAAAAGVVTVDAAPLDRPVWPGTSPGGPLGPTLPASCPHHLLTFALPFGFDDRR
jgi:hypothetical protein